MKWSEKFKELERELKRLVEVVEGYRAEAEGVEREVAGPGAPAARPTRIR